MLGFAWLTLRQAQDALKSGRLEEAHRLLVADDARGHRGSWELLQQLAQALIQRGERHLAHGDATAAWSDLGRAEEVGGPSDSAAARFRQALVKHDLADAKKLLHAGEPGRALEALARLHDRAVQDTSLQLLEEAAKAWTLARDLAARGEFALALTTVERIRSILTETPASLQQFQRELKQGNESFSILIVALHDAVNREDWRTVLMISDKALALAPQHGEARKARARAWKSIEPETAALGRSPEPAPRPASEPPAQRFLLWVDGVGGFLVCLGARVTIGQATPDAFVDVPVFADISRVHAAVTRDAEGYLFEAQRMSQVNGQPAEKALLRPGDRLTLGATCTLQFTQPVPVSATARLDLTSGQRMPLAVDAVFLMADTLVLGPGPQAHVVVPDLSSPVVLFRNKEGLGVRHAGMMQVDGQPCQNRGTLGAAARVTGDDFTFAVEPAGRR
jgi:tetratricopeptide (TPR) repeat protein